MKKVLKRIGIVIGGLVLVLALLIGAMFTEPAFEGNKIKADTVEGSADWMAALEDDLLLNQVSLPGSHDSATQYVQLPYFSKCQNLSIGEQLEAGYRYLDIRLGVDYVDGEAKMVLMHGFTHCKSKYFGSDYLYLDEVLSQVYEFLEEHPTETVVFNVKHEHGDESTAEFQEVLASYIAENPDAWCLTDTIPTVGQARGKILLCRRYSDDKGYGSDAGLDLYWEEQSDHGDTSACYETSENQNLTLAVQDRYEYGYGDKWDAFRITLNDIASLQEENGSDSLVVLNFASTKGELKYGHPHHFAKKMNAQISEQDFSDYSFVGWVIMDFASPELAQTIYEINFQ